MDARVATPTLSVIVTNFNYARYLPVAIDSVLGQSVPVQVIVVDDFSTDESRSVIDGYGARIDAVLQPENRGHGAGFNAGYAQATGDLVMFLDADDFLLPGAVASIIANAAPDVAAYFYRMRYADEAGSLGGVFPAPGIRFSEGDLSAALRATGRYNGTITSGLVFARWALDRVMPMDSEAFRQGGDGYLSTVVPLYGWVRAFDTAVSAYRLHGAQHSGSNPETLASRARWRMKHDAARYDALRLHAGRLGLDVAGDLGEQDLLHIRERVISLMFGPASHPVPTDSITSLLKRARTLTLSRRGGASRHLRAAGWSLLLAVPDAARRWLFLLKIVPAMRPPWFRSLMRSIRIAQAKTIRRRLERPAAE